MKINVDIATREAMNDRDPSINNEPYRPSQATEKVAVRPENVGPSPLATLEPTTGEGINPEAKF